MHELQDSIDFAHGPAWSNRFALAPLTNLQAEPDGSLSEDEYRWLVRRAEGGFGMTMTCASHVSRTGQGFPGQLACWDDKFLPGLERLAGGIRAAGSVSSVQLHHAGERSPTKLIGEQARASFANPETGCRAMTTAEVHQVIEDFTAAAVRCEKAGFDGVELHGAHGYLLANFLNPLNQRTDGYGGDFAGRSRIYYELIDAIRAATGPDFQLGVRISPQRFGVVMSEALVLAEGLMTGGKIDYLDMSLWDCFDTPVEEAYADKPLIDWFTALPRGNCKLGVAGNITSAPTAARCLDHGADFVMIGKGAIIHHDFPRRALADPGFDWIGFPVTREYLVSESVGPAFLGYLATRWKDSIAD